MALYRCGGGGGGKLDETVLWTNPNPTSDFASQSVTLSDDVDNYDYIKFVFNLSTTATTQRSSIYSVGELKTLVNPTNNWSRASSPMRTNSSNTSFVRGIIYQSSNSLAIGNASGYQSSSTSNSALIPYQIIGMKYGNKRPSATPVAVGQFTASTSERTTVSLGFRPKYLCIRQYSSATTPYAVYVCDERFSTTAYQSAGIGGYLANQAYGQTNNNRIYELTDDGFIFNKVASGNTNCAYFAIG